MNFSLRPHHIGWAVPDLAEATKAFIALGYSLEPSLPDANDDSFSVNLRFLRSPGAGPLVELVQPLHEASSVSALLGRAGPGPYHIGYCVDEITVSAGQLRASNYRAVTGQQSAPALGGRMIQFFHRRDVGLIELIQWPLE